MSLPPGASGYFSAPAATLDPHLFSPLDILKPRVRSFIARTVKDALAAEGLKGVMSWLNVWLAGSGVTYQWDAARGNGDLDVLLGVDYTEFARRNEQWSGIDEESAARFINEQLYRNVWPSTALTNFGGQTYEVTFYWTPGIGDNIRRILPTAAYDVLRNGWVVKPPELPPDPTQLYPRDWFMAADLDRISAEGLADRYAAASREFKRMPEGSPGWHNAGQRLNLAISQVRAMHEDIHGSRRLAFGEGGRGYGDWHNFRYQSAKQSGVLGGLHAIIAKADVVSQEADTALYGSPITGAEETLLRAYRWKSGRAG
jgi:hypothetical protein